MRAPTDGFTLIEALITLVIIATLTCLLIPCVTLIRSATNSTRCSHQLQQIAGASSVYASEHDDLFPGRLRQLISRGDLAERILRCPCDASGGTAGTNRPWDLDTDRAEMWSEEQPCSYLYETSCSLIGTGPNSQYWYFYYYTPDRGEEPPPGKPLPTWLDAKHTQLKTGNLGAPFAADDMPILRCFWHQRWSSQRNGTVRFDRSKALSRKVVNVTWNLGVIMTIPQWEHQANEDIPLWTDED
jgi:prepilin-type N-terminal cleavage/methylation domain-containing protein